MNVCCICQGDGVLIAASNWYCLNHLSEGFVATARAIAHMRGHDPYDASMKAEEWATEL